MMGVITPPAEFTSHLAVSVCSESKLLLFVSLTLPLRFPVSSICYPHQHLFLSYKAFISSVYWPVFQEPGCLPATVY